MNSGYTSIFDWAIPVSWVYVIIYLKSSISLVSVFSVLDMTYNVFGGTLSLTQSISLHGLLCCVCVGDADTTLLLTTKCALSSRLWKQKRSN